VTSNKGRIFTCLRTCLGDEVLYESECEPLDLGEHWAKVRSNIQHNRKERVLRRSNHLRFLDTASQSKPAHTWISDEIPLLPLPAKHKTPRNTSNIYLQIGSPHSNLPSHPLGSQPPKLQATRIIPCPSASLRNVTPDNTAQHTTLFPNPSLPHVFPATQHQTRGVRHPRKGSVSQPPQKNKQTIIRLPSPGLHNSLPTYSALSSDG
jgi:hypothetical protein